MKHVRHILREIRRTEGAFRNLKRNGILMEEQKESLH